MAPMRLASPRPQVDADARRRSTSGWQPDPWDDPDITDARSRAPTPISSVDQVDRLLAGMVAHRRPDRRRRRGVGGTSARSTRPATQVPVEVSRCCRADAIESISERLQDEGSSTTPGSFAWYVDHNGGLELTPGYYELRPSDHIGNLLRRPAHAAAQTYTKVTFPEGFTVQQDGRTVVGEVAAGWTPQGFLDRRHRRRRSRRASCSPKARRRSRACFSPTPTRSRTTRAQVDRPADDRPDGARRPTRRTSSRRRGGRRPHAVPDPDHRVDDRTRGEGRRGPPEDRPGHLQPLFQMRHAVADRRHAALRHNLPAPPISDVMRPRHAVQHLSHTAACRRRRSPTPAGRRSRPRCNPAPNPSQGDPICVDLPNPKDATTCTTCSPTRTAATCSPRRTNSTRPTCSARDLGLLGADRRRTARSPRSSARPSPQPVAARLHKPGSPRPASTGVRRVRRRPGGAAAGAVDAMRVLGLGGLSVTMPHKEAVAGPVDELDPAAAALRSVNTVVPLGDGRLAATAPTATASSPRWRPSGIDVVGRSVCRSRVEEARREHRARRLRAGAAAITVCQPFGRARRACGGA